MTTYEEISNAIGDAIQRHSPDGTEGAVLTGWTLVAEWMDPDGDRWLSKIHPPHLTSWQSNGMHHEALHGHWPDPDDT